MAYAEQVSVLGVIKNISTTIPSQSVFAESYCRTPTMQRHRNSDPEALAELNGPALLAYNCSQFSEDDWIAVRTISDSSKKNRHIQDREIWNWHQVMLSFLSGDTLLTFDPQKLLFKEGYSRLSIKEDAAAVAGYLEPFRSTPGWKPDGSFTGTVIRMPLPHPPDNAQGHHQDRRNQGLGTASMSVEETNPQCGGRSSKSLPSGGRSPSLGLSPLASFPSDEAEAALVAQHGGTGQRTSDNSSHSYASHGRPDSLPTFMPSSPSHPLDKNLRNPGDNTLVKGSSDHRFRSVEKASTGTRFLPESCSTQSHRTWLCGQCWGRVIPSVYGEVFIATSHVSSEVLDVLVSLGMPISKPPAHLIELLTSNCPTGLRMLTPETVAAELKESYIPAVEERAPSNWSILLNFLLSTSQITNIIGLPIIPTVNSSYVTLYKREDAMVEHTLFEDLDATIFKPCDPDAINLKAFSKSVAALLRRQGPETLNVKPLDPDRVINYLTLGAEQLGLSTNPNAVHALSAFWLWFDKWTLKNQLLPRLQPLSLIPCTQGLKQANHPAFVAKVDGPVRQLLEQLGVPFLASTFHDKAKLVCSDLGLSKTSVIYTLYWTLCHALYRHFMEHSPKSVALRSDFHPNQRDTLKRLPIYPLVSSCPDSGGVVERWGPVASGSLYGISSTSILPNLEGVVYMRTRDRGDEHMLAILGAKSPMPLDDLALLKLALSSRSFSSQPRPILKTILQYLASQRFRLAEDFTRSLKREPFVRAQDGRLAAPQDLIAASNPLYSLYSADPQRIASSTDDIDRQILDAASTLQLLDGTLSVSNVEGRIRWISNNTIPEAVQHALKLFKVLYDAGFRCDTLSNDALKLKWIPTKSGQLAASSACRPIPDDSLQLALFDKVLEPLHPSANCPTFAGPTAWLGPTHHWVPTEEGQLVEPAFAVFRSAIPNAGIYGISFQLTSPANAGVTNLLEYLGCLSDLTDYSFPTIHRLRPRAEIVFNDIGERSILVERDDFFLASTMIDVNLANALRIPHLGIIAAGLGDEMEDMGASALTLVQQTLKQYTEKQFLSEFLANAHDAGATTFSVILNDFSLPPTDAPRVLKSSTMKEFYDCPSVMIYNDSLFSDEDFKGILKTHVGGKRDNDESVGQFGLGALTMFHFTELAIIISGKNVLFLDPSKKNLPPSLARASFKRSLKDLEHLSWYPDHLAVLKGLEIYDDEAGCLDGTVFLLPLRRPTHCNHESSISSKTWDPMQFKEIADDFQATAKECLFFTNIKSVHSKIRPFYNADGPDSWTISVAREEQEETSGLTVVQASITEECRGDMSKTSSWLIVSRLVSRTEIPDRLRRDDTKQIRIGLAVPVDGSPISPKFFSTLPLAIKTSLPVHINASFVLSADRRQIRGDELGGKHTRFNRWLLTDRLSFLYLEFLQEIGKAQDNSRFWPASLLAARDGDKDSEEPLSGCLVDGFYTALLSQKQRPVFSAMFSPGSSVSLLSFEDAVLYHSSKRLPPSVKALLEHCHPHSIVNTQIPVKRREQTKLPIVDPAFVAELLRGDSRAVQFVRELEKGRYQEFMTPRLAPALRRHVVEIRGRSRGETKFIWNGIQPNVFTSSSFVQPFALSAELETMITEANLGVAWFNAQAVKGMIEQQLRTILPDHRTSWARQFWDSFTRLPDRGLLEAIAPLALIPSTNGGYVSLDACKNQTALLTSSLTSEDDPLLQVQDMGIMVVVRNACPEHLQSILASREYGTPGTFLSRLLRAMGSRLRDVLTTMGEWPHEKRTSFSTWFCPLISSKLPEADHDIARRLPVWYAQKHSGNAWLPATDINILPPPLTIDTARFLDIFVCTHPAAYHLKVELLKFERFNHHLVVPAQLAPQDEAVYMTILEWQLGQLGWNSDFRGSLRVPNAARTMVDSGILYSRKPIFEAAFGQLRTDKFLLRAYSIIEPRLIARNLIKDDSSLDDVLFSTCALALHQDAAATPERARVLYDAYCERLPMFRRRDVSWATMDTIRFIPRDMSPTKRHGENELPLPLNITTLPAIVCPNSLVRSEFEDIAWTQLARFESQPSLELVFYNTKLGIPAVAQVVAHLRALRLMRQGPDVLHYLKKTYEWLSTKSPTSAVTSAMSTLRDEKLFLNVEDPTTDPWQWAAAHEMALENHDVENIQRVRKFLLPFKPFLEASGVIDVKYPDMNLARDHGTSDDDELQVARKGFEEMRENRTFTDVVFTSQEEDDLAPEARTEFFAHRNFLSAFGGYFKDMFTGNFQEARQASVANPVRISLSHSKFCHRNSPRLSLPRPPYLTSNSKASRSTSFLEVVTLSNYLDLKSLFPKRPARDHQEATGDSAQSRRHSHSSDNAGATAPGRSQWNPSMRTPSSDAESRSKGSECSGDRCEGDKDEGGEDHNGSTLYPEKHSPAEMEEANLLQLGSEAIRLLDCEWKIRAAKEYILGSAASFKLPSQANKLQKKTWFRTSIPVCITVFVASVNMVRRPDQFPFELYQLSLSYGRILRKVSFCAAQWKTQEATILCSSVHIHPYAGYLDYDPIMDRASSVVAAFQAGKLPTTEQINSFIDWLNDVGITQVEPEANTELSSRGRVVAGSLRRTLDAYRGLANNKNGDNILQEGLWHLTEGDLTVDSEVDANKDQAKKDIHDLRKALRNLFSVVWDSLARPRTHSEVSTDEVQSGQRDTLGRDKQRLEEEKDTKVAWEHGMDTVKGAGSTVIDTTRSATQTAEEKAEKTSQRIQDAWNKISERAQKDEQYRQALDTIFTILQTRLNQTMDAAADPASPSQIHQRHHPRTTHLQSTSGQLPPPSCETRIFVPGSTTPLPMAARSLLSPASPTLKPPSNSEGSSGSAGVPSWRRTDKWKQQIEALKAEWEKIDQGIANDEDVKQTAKVAGKEAVNKVGEGLQQVGAEVKENQSTIEAAMEQATWFWQDLFKVYIPRAMSKMKDIPIPRTEYKDSELEFVIENLDILLLQLPSLAPLQVKLDDVSFWYNDKTAGALTPGEFTGLLGITLPEKGIDLDLRSTHPRHHNRRQLSREPQALPRHSRRPTWSSLKTVTIDVRESNHAVIATLFKPMLVARLRDALSRTMSEQLRFVIEWADSVAFDVSKASTSVRGYWSWEVEDLLLAAMCANLVLSAASLASIPPVPGIIVEQQKVIQGNIETGEDSRVEKAQFSAVRSVDLWVTGSEPLVKKLKEMGQEVGVGRAECCGLRFRITWRWTQRHVKDKAVEGYEKAKGAVKEVKDQVETFRASVDRKAKLEEKEMDGRVLPLISKRVGYPL
ncbi:hypothetical protein BKA70DRAFT_1227194 [Coprinopsis sp. MPI-PUGE-AT-0042]|nr:hypothetical protein BKA70DRAFT_1227194 [Coprinopsis sp. MPI-PUGE-AT-0042]